MKTLIPVIAVLLSFLLVPSAFADVISITAADDGNRGDTYVDSADSINHGTSVELAVGTVTTHNFSSILKFNINSSYIPSSMLSAVSDHIASSVNAELFLAIHNTVGLTVAEYPNITVWGNSNQSWREEFVKYPDFSEQIMLPANNATLEAWNNSFNGAVAENKWMKWNITGKLLWYVSQGFDNATFIVNASDMEARTWTGYVNFKSKESTDSLFRPMLNVTILFYMGIQSPLNTTYYNNFTLPLNVSNNTFNADKWFYSLNGGANISFNPNTSIIVSNGNNIITVWANDSANNWWRNYVVFNIGTACDSSTEGNVICSGDSMAYVVYCKRFSYSLYQWDTDNMTYCKDGCFDGHCMQKTSQCMDKCKLNESYCTSANEAVNCINYPQYGGCNDWNTTSSYCPFGCSNGICIQNHNTCTPHESKCLQNDQGDYVTFCVDDNGDGFYDWSLVNKTFCTMGCKETANIVTGAYNATCNYHSFNDVYALQNIIIQVITPINYAFKYTPVARYILWFILTLAITFGVGYLTKNWQISIAAMVISLFAGGVLNWLPIYIPILIIIIAGSLLFFVLEGGDKDG